MQIRCRHQTTDGGHRVDSTYALDVNLKRMIVRGSTGDTMLPSSPGGRKASQAKLMPALLPLTPDFLRFHHTGTKKRWGAQSTCRGQYAQQLRGASLGAVVAVAAAAATCGEHWRWGPRCCCCWLSPRRGGACEPRSTVGTRRARPQLVGRRSRAPASPWVRVRIDWDGGLACGVCAGAVGWELQGCMSQRGRGWGGIRAGKPIRGGFGLRVQKRPFYPYIPP